MCGTGCVEFGKEPLPDPDGQIPEALKVFAGASFMGFAELLPLAAFHWVPSCS